MRLMPRSNHGMSRTGIGNDTHVSSRSWPRPNTPGTSRPQGSFGAVKPRHAAYMVAAWLGGIVVNLLNFSGYYDVALRDFGLMLAALTLWKGATLYEVSAPLHGGCSSAKRSSTVAEGSAR
jgi:hypothetical protein